VETDFEKPETVMVRVSRGRWGSVKEGDNGFQRFVEERSKGTSRVAAGK
jgi:hypothetical protein